MRRISQLGLVALSIFVTATVATACGGTSRTRGGDGTGQDGVAEGDGGTTAGGSSGGASGGGSTGTLPTDPPVVAGTLVLAGANLTIAGITTDDFIVVRDPDNSKVKVIDVAGASVGEIAATGTSRVRVRGKAVFVWSDVANNAGTLRVWTQAGGVVDKGTGSPAGFAGASDDGTRLAYMLPGTAPSARIVLDKSGAVSDLVAAVDYTTGNGDCLEYAEADFEPGAASPRIFVGNCEPGSSGRYNLRFFGENGGAATAQVSTGGGAQRFRYLDFYAVFPKSGSRLVLQTMKTTDSGTMRVFDFAGTELATLGDAWTYEYSVADDFSSVYFLEYNTGASWAVKHAPLGQGTFPVATAAAAGKADTIGWVSPNNQSLLVGPNWTDITYTSTAGVLNIATGNVTSVYSTNDATVAPFDASFTSDSNYAFFLAPEDDNGTGTLRIVPTAGGTPINFGTTVSYVHPLKPGGTASSKMLIQDVFDPAATTWLTSLYTYDVAAGGEPKLLASQLDDYWDTVANDTKVAYASVTGDAPGIYVVPLP